MVSIRIKKEGHRMQDKTEDDFFVDWCYHFCDFTGGIEDRKSILIETKKCLVGDITWPLCILISDRLVHRKSINDNLLSYMSNDNFLDFFNRHEEERVKLKHVDRFYCTPQLCGCGSQEDGGCNNPFFRSSDMRRIVNGKVRYSDTVDK